MYHGEASLVRGLRGSSQRELWKEIMSMGAFDAIIFVGCTGFATLIVITVLTIIGVRREETSKTLIRQRASTIPTGLARRVLGAYVRSPSYKHRPSINSQYTSLPGVRR
jgi:hypothetical protein